QSKQAAPRPLGGDRHGGARDRVALDLDDHVRPHRTAAPRRGAPRADPRPPEAHGWLHRVRAARLHPREERAVQPHARAARGVDARGPAHDRGVAAVPAPVDPERADVVGEDGAQAGADGAALGRERLRRHADGRVDQPRVGRRLRREPPGGRDAPIDPRGGPHARAAQHHLRDPRALRGSRAGPSVARAEGGARALRADPLAPRAGALRRQGRAGRAKLTGISEREALPRAWFARIDPSPDPLFYAAPRLVNHIDDATIAELTDYYREVLP